MTVQFPIDALTPKWSIGINRPVDRSHVHTLRRIFTEQGVRREEPANRLRIICTKHEVERMMTYLAQDQSQPPKTHPDNSSRRSWPNFCDWPQVNNTKVELMAGNHRVEALKEYLEGTKSSGEDRWWICDIYDKGTISSPLLPAIFRDSR